MNFVLKTFKCLGLHCTCTSFVVRAPTCDNRDRLLSTHNLNKHKISKALRRLVHDEATCAVNAGDDSEEEAWSDDNDDDESDEHDTANLSSLTSVDDPHDVQVHGIPPLWRLHDWLEERKKRAPNAFNGTTVYTKPLTKKLHSHNWHPGLNAWIKPNVEPNKPKGKITNSTLRRFPRQLRLKTFR